MKISSSGMTIIEVMIAAALFMVVFLGASTATLAFLKSLNNINAKNTMTTLRNNISSIVMGNAGWRLTVADAVGNPDMDCLRNGTACTANTDFPLFLRDGNNQAFLDGNLTLPDPLVGTNLPGFNRFGQPCATFDADNGNAQCPYTYRLTWRALCNGGAPLCTNPSIRVAGTLIYKPDADVTAANQVNMQSGNISLVREMAMMNQPVILKQSLVGGASGACSTNPAAWTDRVLNVEVSDPGDNVSLPGGPGTSTFILKPGTYTCQISAPGYRVGLFKIHLWDVTNSSVLAESASVDANSALTQSAVAVLYFTFTIGADTSYQVRQLCSLDPGTGEGLGYTTGLATAVDLTVINCRRIN